MENIYSIEKICGISNDSTSLEDIANDPNFVFNNDPNYETLVLYGPEGQIINVNSWIECANYVNGGWSSGLVETVNYEMYYFFALLSSTILYFLVNKLRSR